MKSGTTPSWLRPTNFYLSLRPRACEVDLVLLLAFTGMAQSAAEARRLLKQGAVWIDRLPALHREGTICGRTTTILDRLEDAVPLMRGRFLYVESGDCVCVGGKAESAVCHRINFL